MLMTVRKHKNKQQRNKTVVSQYEEETKREKEKIDMSKHECHKNLLFFPLTRYMRAWEFITTIALILACVMTPYSLAFDDKESQD